MTENPHRVSQNEAALSPPPRWPWWLTATSPRQALKTLIGPTLLIVPILLRTNRSEPRWLPWVSVLLIAYWVGSVVATIVALRRHPNLQYATHQPRPLGRSTRHRYAVATLIGLALAVIAVVVALLVETSFAWLAPLTIGLLTLWSFAQLARPLLDRHAASGTR